MIEPPPTLADQWSQWKPVPTIPEYWPGLGNEHRGDGFGIDRRGVKAVAGKLIKRASDDDKLTYAFGQDYGRMSGKTFHWKLPGDLGELLDKAEFHIAKFWRDLHVEVGMAGFLIERASTRYDLAEQPLLGDMSTDRLDKILLHPSATVLWTPDSHYPKGEERLELPAAADYGVDHMTAEMAKRDIEHLPRGGGSGPEPFEQIAGDLTELANSLRSGAQDLRDAPWHGGAADNAQGALRQIYANTTALAAACGGLGAASRRFKEVADWCRRSFQEMEDLDLERSGAGGIWGPSSIVNGWTRNLLTEANNEFLDVYGMMPKRLKEDLPGLLINEENLAQLNRNMKIDTEAAKKSSPPDAHLDEWLERWRPIVRDREQAEKEYG
ncbi:hypothetical protein [Nonomuraea sp. LPB2021202275-12-8]|uniref:hypothetical protein n=1 Tax=Nonomuraea sp. LPB2021202275-12-8 TaxID=3120159 RepID=UPI00300CB0B2